MTLAVPTAEHTPVFLRKGAGRAPEPGVIVEHFIEEVQVMGVGLLELREREVRYDRLYRGPRKLRHDWKS